MPFYKWSFHALRQLDGAAGFAENLSFLLSGDNRSDVVSRKKSDIIEEVSSAVIGILQRRGITRETCADLERHAYSVNDAISDSTIRNMHILEAI